MPITATDHRRMWAPIRAMKALFAHKDACEERAKDLAANVAVARAVRVQAMTPSPKAEPKAMLNDYSFDRSSKYSAQHVAELTKMQNQAADELAELSAKADGPGLSDTEGERMEEVLAAHDAIKAELKRMDKARAARTRAAGVVASVRGDRSRNRYSGLVSADEEGDGEEGDNEDDDEEEDVKPASNAKTARARSTVAYIDQSGREIRSLSMDEPFGGRASRRSDGQRRPTLGERVAAHLGIKPLSGINNAGPVWEGSDGSGGYLTGIETLREIVNPARPATVCFPAGAQMLQLNESETVLIEQLTDPEAHWTPELGRVPGSGMTFGRIVLRPKKLAALVPISIEMMEDALNAPEMIQKALIQAFAIAIDQAVLSGSGVGEQPKGIRNHAGVNTHTIVGAPAGDYSDLETALEKIRLANYVGEDSALSWIRHPRDASQYNRLQDTLMQPLQPTPGAAALRKFQTTSLPINLGGGAESEMIVGDFSQIIIGMRTTATIRILPAGTVDIGAERFDASEQFGAIVAMHARVDVAVIRPQWLTVVDGVDWT